MGQWGLNDQTAAPGPIAKINHVKNSEDRGSPAKSGQSRHDVPFMIHRIDRNIQSLGREESMDTMELQTRLFNLGNQDS